MKPTPLAPYFNECDRNQYRIVRKALIPNLLCLRRAVFRDICTHELTASQVSDFRVTPRSRCRERRRDLTLVDQPRVHMELAMKNLIARFVKDESGATAIEYGLIAAGISIVIITAVNGIGSTLKTNFQNISTSLK